ncbi:unnamed protein product [Didymodactylos carnosus]|uniref:Uncharacterized protein n=1 Tax=Didymodactylos carnosus TaxID=1234261 RepID=A0A814SQE5_9BILA|nr:unnamed protein product [Didymodactylos carnosus]CAF3914059.1 unnamed protein product [Didymodactylos carnosus]
MVASRLKRTINPPNNYTPDNSFYCVFDNSGQDALYSVIHEDEIIGKRGKNIIIIKNNKRFEKIVIAKAPATQTKLVRQSVLKRGNEDDETEDDYNKDNELLSGTSYFACQDSLRKTIKTKSPLSTSQSSTVVNATIVAAGDTLDDPRSSMNSTTSNTSNSNSSAASYTTTLPNEVVSTISNQINNLGKQFYTLARQTKELIKSKKHDYEVDTSSTFLKEIKYENENLLEVGGASPAEYGRRVLQILFNKHQLATHSMPHIHRTKSRQNDLPQLDEEK